MLHIENIVTWLSAWHVFVKIVEMTFICFCKRTLHLLISVKNDWHQFCDTCFLHINSFIQFGIYSQVSLKPPHHAPFPFPLSKYQKWPQHCYFNLLLIHQFKELLPTFKRGTKTDWHSLEKSLSVLNFYTGYNCKWKSCNDCFENYEEVRDDSGQAFKRQEIMHSSSPLQTHSFCTSGSSYNIGVRWRACRNGIA